MIKSINFSILFVALAISAHPSNAAYPLYNHYQQIYSYQDGPFNPANLFPKEDEGTRIPITQHLSASFSITGFGNSFPNFNHFSIPTTAAGRFGISYRF